MTEPINVTPGHEQSQQPAHESFPNSAFGAGGSSNSFDGDWRSWSWPTQRGGFPWLGVLLVLVGACLLIQVAVPSVSLGTLFLLGPGLTLLASWVAGGSIFVIVPGLLILALGVAPLISETGLYTGPGTTALALAAAFAAMWLIFAARDRRRTWPLWGVGIFGLIGLIEVSSRIASIPDYGAVWPALIIVIGLILVVNSRGGQPRPRRGR